MSAHSLLLVEEEAVLADVTAFRLELLGYAVHTVGSAEQALDFLKQRRVELAIVDLHQPGMSGLALIERLASDPATSGMPVMAISFEAELELVQQAFLAGAVDYLVAPYDPRVLEEKVEQILSQTAAVPAAAAG